MVKKNRDADSEELFRKMELHLLRQEMASRQLSRQQLARKTGYTVQRIANLLSGSDKSWPIRLVMNRLFCKEIFTRPSRAIAACEARVLNKEEKKNEGS